MVFVERGPKQEPGGPGGGGGGAGGLLMAATWTRGHQQSLSPRVSTKTELPQGLPYGSKIQFHTCR